MGCAGSGKATTTAPGPWRSGSRAADLYSDKPVQLGRSVNFITAHDGFTLADLVSYNRKHNLANGEDNRDGENHNNSWNHGIEGPTTDPGGAETATTPAAKPAEHAAAGSRSADAADGR